MNWSDTPEASPEQKMEGYKLSAARSISRACIEALPLKAPSTAHYERPAVIPDPADASVFLARSYVDSQNSFGAMIRSYWSMKLKYTGTENSIDVDVDKNWKIQEFLFDGEKATCLR